MPIFFCLSNKVSAVEGISNNQGVELDAAFDKVLKA